MYAALNPTGPARNLVLLTMPVDTSDSLYTTWLGRESFDVDQGADYMGNMPGGAVDWANKLMKPVNNYVTTKRRLFEQVEDVHHGLDRTGVQVQQAQVQFQRPLPGGEEALDPVDHLAEQFIGVFRVGIPLHAQAALLPVTGDRRRRLACLNSQCFHS